MPSPSSGAQTIELCTLTKPAALYSDSRLRTREGTARQGETLEILGRQARAWELRLRTTESLAHNAAPTSSPQYAKARRLKQVCQLKQHQVAVPTQPEEDIQESAEGKEPSFRESETQTLIESTEAPSTTPSDDAQIEPIDVKKPAPEPSQPTPTPSVPEPTPLASDNRTESLEQVDLMGDRYWLDRDRKVAVRDVTLTNASLPPLLAESLSSVIAAELQYRSRGRFQVISRGDLRNIIAQQTEAQMMGCTSDSCMMDSELANADNILTSSVERLGESTILTIELFDTELQRVMRRQAVAWRGDDAGLVDLARSYLTWIVEGSRAADMRGSLQVVSDQDGAKALINGKEMGKPHQLT